MNKMITAALACAAFTAAPAFAQMTSGSSSGQTMPSGGSMSGGSMSGQSMSGDMSTMPVPAPADFVKMAGASDMFELSSSRTVLSSTKDPKVRQFAQMMIKDHTKSTADVKKAAMKDKVALAPPQLNAMQTQMLNQLRAAKGADRDSLYMQQQLQSHQMALQLNQSYAASGTAPNLKMVAGMIVPVVQSHLQMAQSGGSMASGM